MYKNQYTQFSAAFDAASNSAKGITAEVDEAEISEVQKIQLKMYKEFQKVKNDNATLKKSFSKDSIMETVTETPTKSSVAKDIDPFLKKLAQSESSGDYSAENKEGYVGLLQIGKARLKDFNKANGTNFTMDKFKNSKSMQDRVNRWHISDIDRVYDEKGISINRDSFRAIAHLGGISGALKYIKTDGKYNPADSNNTKLSDYAAKFGGTA